MTNFPYLVGAYMIFWVATLVYLISIDRRQKEVRRELQEALTKRGN